MSSESTKEEMFQAIEAHINSAVAKKEPELTITINDLKRDLRWYRAEMKKIKEARAAVARAVGLPATPKDDAVLARIGELQDALGAANEKVSSLSRTCEGSDSMGRPLSERDHVKLSYDLSIAKRATETAVYETDLIKTKLASLCKKLGLPEETNLASMCDTIEELQDHHKEAEAKVSALRQAYDEVVKDWDRDGRALRSELDKVAEFLGLPHGSMSREILRELKSVRNPPSDKEKELDRTKHEVILLEDSARQSKDARDAICKKLELPITSPIWSITHAIFKLKGDLEKASENKEALPTGNKGVEAWRSNMGAVLRTFGVIPMGSTNPDDPCEVKLAIEAELRIRNAELDRASSRLKLLEKEEN